MQIREIVEYLNSRFLPVYQESYDNAGLLIGDVAQTAHGVLVTVDVTPDVVDEAIETGANLIVSHHPLIFGSGLKRITPDNETGQMVMHLLQNGIAVYAAHTNLDNLSYGVNGILAEKLGLQKCTILRPLQGELRKLVTYAPVAHAEQVREALFAAGAGGIGAYDHCSWSCDGEGTFRANEGCNPFCGGIGELHHEKEVRIEVIYPSRIERKLLAELRKAHPYEEPAIDCIPLSNRLESVGAGMVGYLPHPTPAGVFLEQTKQRLGIPVIRCSALGTKGSETPIHKVAICGGSGSFLIGDAKACGADIYLTGDLKYHDFQSAEQRIILADIGHYESEQFTKELFYQIISEKFPNFACQISKKDRGYIEYI